MKPWTKMVWAGSTNYVGRWWRGRGDEVMVNMTEGVWHHCEYCVAECSAISLRMSWGWYMDMACSSWTRGATFRALLNEGTSDL